MLDSGGEPCLVVASVEGEVSEGWESQSVFPKGRGSQAVTSVGDQDSKVKSWLPTELSRDGHQGGVCVGG